MTRNDLTVVFFGTGIICVITPNIYSVSTAFATVLFIIAGIMWLLGVLNIMRNVTLKKRIEKQKMTIEYAMFLIQSYIRDNENATKFNDIQFVKALQCVNEELVSRGLCAKNEYSILGYDKDNNCNLNNLCKTSACNEKDNKMEENDET